MSRRGNCIARRLARGVQLEAILEVVCRTYRVEPSELSRRGSRHEAQRCWHTWRGGTR